MNDKNPTYTVNYDEDADVLYVSFSRSRQVTGVELADNVLLRLDTGAESGEAPRAVGLTFISFQRLMAAHKDRPLRVSLTNLRSLPDDLWLATLSVVTTPPVSDFLSVDLAIAPHFPPLPQPA